MDRRVALALVAARQAWEAASCQPPPARLGVFVGAEFGRPSFETLVFLARAGLGSKLDRGERMLDALRVGTPPAASDLSAAAVASTLAREVRAKGPVSTLSLACASGSAAIIEATRALRCGECDVALTGGVGADVDPMMFAAFGLLGALSTRGKSRPFDARRDGFVLGEGAAMFVLSVEREGALAEVAGVGRALDAHRLTAPDPDGQGAARAIQSALADARTDAVDHVQAHGTSTPLNDVAETVALARTLGTSLARAHVSSVKGALGHWIAGAGALGVACACEAVTSGTILPTAGLELPDAACALPHVVGRALRRPVGSVLVNAFGFGGANASIVVRGVS
jgi:3-oxoacyl-[acyl-carrier-protein] synthase II